MSLSLSGSSQYLKNTTNIVASYPFTIGMWIQPASLPSSVASLWSATDGTASPTNFLSVDLLSSGQCRTNGNGFPNDTAISGAFAAGMWGFVLAQFASATSRSGFVITMPASTFSPALNTTSRTPSGLNQEYVGALGASTPTDLFHGQIAEFWRAKSALFTASAAMKGLVWTIALRGPFALPDLAASLVEYRSLRKGFYDDGSDRFTVGATTSWSQIGSPIIGPHTPYLAADFVRPGTSRVFVPI